MALTWTETWMTDKRRKEGCVSNNRVCTSPWHVEKFGQRAWLIFCFH